VNATAGLMHRQERDEEDMILSSCWTGWFCRLSVAFSINSCMVSEATTSTLARLEDQVGYRYSSLSLS
jgi:hypothetical protein